MAHAVRQINTIYQELFQDPGAQKYQTRCSGDQPTELKGQNYYLEYT